MIHRLARSLTREIGDGPVDATSPQGRFAQGAALLHGEQLVRAGAWGKYLFVDWTGGHCLHVHLGLIGKFREVGPEPPPPRDSIRLRLRNDRHIVTIFYSADDRTWTRFGTTMEVSGYHHNVAGEFLSLRPAIYAAGTGEVRFRQFIYRALD